MKQYALFLVLLLSLGYSYGQRADLKFDHFTQETGLPDQQIKFTLQDHHGYMWIGTLLGLVRYDGYSLKVYALDGRKKDEFISSLITDDDDNLYVSTTGIFGLVHSRLFEYNRQQDNFTQLPYTVGAGGQNGYLFLKFADGKGNLWGYYNYYNSGLSLRRQNRVFKYEVDKKAITFFDGRRNTPASGNALVTLFGGKKPGGAIWMGGQSGLYLFDYQADKFSPFLLGGAAPSKSVTRIYEAPSEPGVLWLSLFDQKAKKTVIERLNTHNKTFKDYDLLNNSALTAANDTVNAMYEDSHRRLWFATQNGLVLFNRESQKFTAFAPNDLKNAPGANNIFLVTEAKDASLWLISGAGLVAFDPDTHVFNRYTYDPKKPEGLSQNFLTDLFFDHSGILWTSTQSGGVDKVDALSSAFSTYPFQVRDGSFYQIGFTNNVTPAPGGRCLFSNDQGIYSWKPGSHQAELVYKIRKTDVGIDALCAGNDGRIYFNNKHGMSVYGPATGKLENYAASEHDSASISGNIVNRILQDHTGLVWVGTTHNGICSFDPATKKFKRYSFAKTGDAADNKGKLDNEIVDCIFEDHTGDIWVGTHLGGLNRFDRKTGTFRSYYLDGKVNAYSVTHLAEDTQGHIWVGTYAQGLSEFDPNTGHYIYRLNEDNGLLFNTVTGITADNKGYLWIGSVRGLTRLDPKSKEFKTFPTEAILPGRSILDDYNLTQVDNQMVVVLSDGIAVFNPRNLDANPYPPAVHIEKVSYNNPAATSDSTNTKFTDGSSRLELPYNQNRVTFTYIALHYADPSQNRYAYRLDGYDNHWIQAGTQRSTTYTNLPAGTYTFRVKAANSDRVWNNTGDTLTVIIDAPWWLRWWAWLLYVVLFVAAVYALVAYRSRKLMHDKKILEHKVRVRTEEVLQQKEEIESQRDHLEKAFSDLKLTQTQLIQSEKMASLGELTAGIAHEIQNPLNFVNNFSEVNKEMLEELKAESEKPKGERDERLEIELINGLIENEEKINHHGKRADSIVKGMLQHSKTGGSAKEPTDLNALAEEYLRLAYHGLRAKDKDFNAEMILKLDKQLPKISVVPQDIGRVFLNLFNNAFYAVNQKKKTVTKSSSGAGSDYKPTVELITFAPPLPGGGWGAIVKDNGTGIPDSIKEKIMQPFFTTKPTGEGTGLGLSLTYDIVVKGHAGKIEVSSNESEFTEFTITLPL